MARAGGARVCSGVAGPPTGGLADSARVEAVAAGRKGRAGRFACPVAELVPCAHAPAAPTAAPPCAFKSRTIRAQGAQAGARRGRGRRGPVRAPARRPGKTGAGRGPSPLTAGAGGACVRPRISWKYPGLCRSRDRRAAQVAAAEGAWTAAKSTGAPVPPRSRIDRLRGTADRARARGGNAAPEDENAGPAMRMRETAAGKKGLQKPGAPGARGLGGRTARRPSRAPAMPGQYAKSGHGRDGKARC